jgi:hypothetical protein
MIRIQPKKRKSKALLPLKKFRRQMEKNYGGKFKLFLKPTIKRNTN